MINTNDEIMEYWNYFDYDAWSEYTNINDRMNAYDSDLGYGEQNCCFQELKETYLAVNICTYHRLDEVRRNVQRLLESKFFDKSKTEFYGHLHIYVTDNG